MIQIIGRKYLTELLYYLQTIAIKVRKERERLLVHDVLIDITKKHLLFRMTQNGHGYERNVGERGLLIWVF